MKTVKSPQLLDIFSKRKLNKKKDEEKETIIIDYREKNSLVASYLIKLGFKVDFKELKIGDYIVKDGGIYTEMDIIFKNPPGLNSITNLYLFCILFASSKTAKI